MPSAFRSGFRIRPRASHGILVLIAATLSGLIAPQDDTADGRPILDAMLAFYADQPQMQAAIEVRIDAPGMPPGMGGSTVHQLSVQRPDKLALRQVGGTPAGTFVVNGTNRYTAMDPMQQYSLQQGPATLDAALAEGTLLVPTIPASLVLMNLLGDASTPGGLAAAEQVELLGTERLEGFDCQHLRVSSGGMDVELWIDAGEQPWLRRLLPLPPEDMADAATEGMIMVVPDFWLREWSAGPVAAEVFSTAPPPGFTQVDSVIPDFGEMMGGGGTVTRGQAPDLELDLLEGESVQIASLRGKVVVLAFWATWCKPCLMELPILIELTNELADRDVVLYAINLAEPEPIIRAGLEKYELDLTVVLDRQMKLAGAFGVTPIPHTVIIDQDGDIVAEHVGFTPGIGKIVRREIEALLSD